MTAAGPGSTSLPGPLVVSLLPRSLAGLERALVRRVHRGADVLEIRLDLVAEEVVADPSVLRRLIALAAKPVIAALHGAEGFGTFAGSPADRLDVWLAARSAGALFVDVDEAFAEAAGDLGGPRVLSTHGVAPDAGSLRAGAERAEALCEHPGDLIKLVPPCASAREGLALLEWLAARVGTSAGSSIVAFGSGELARFTRMLAPAFGSALVYGAPFDSPDGFAANDLVPAAPGQVSVALMRRVWPHGGPGPKTAIAAVAGVPIDHSAGPVVHGAACRAAGIDGVLVPVAPEALADLWAFPAVRARLAGLSVTAPFKGDAAGAAAERDGGVQAMGAANTLVPLPTWAGPGGGWRACNTDAPAVVASLREAGAEITGAEALVMGAGGAARAAAYALTEGGARVTVAARSVVKAEAMAESLGGGVRAIALGGPRFHSMRPDLIVHATPLGTRGAGCPPVAKEMIRPASWTLDAVYRPERTELLERVAQWGGGTVSGMTWFLGQAWLQHVLIFGERYAEAGLDVDAEPDLCERIREAMGAAFAWWGEGESPLSTRSVLALVGLRGAGKSTVGREVARLLGGHWLDLDHEVAKAAGTSSAADVIERDGLGGFRLLESAALLEAMVGAAARFESSGAVTVLSTGGGALESERSVDLLERGAVSIWLRAPYAALAQRVALDASNAGGASGHGGVSHGGRPALVKGAASGSVDEFTALGERRNPIFDRLADATIEVERLSVEAVVAEVCRAWNHAR